MRVEVRTAQDEREVDEAYELAARTFGPDYFTARQAMRLARRLDPVTDLRDVMVAVSDGAIVGFLRILDRAVWLGGTVLKVGGIASVCIHPDFRGRGYGRAIMDAAVTRLWERKDVLSIVFGRRAVDGFYSHWGYVGLGCHPEAMVIIGSRKSFDSNGVTLQRGIDERLLKLYASAYDEAYQTLFLSFYRSPAWWTRFPLGLASKIGGEGLVTVMNERNPVGYFIVRDGKVIEVGSLNGQEWVVTAGILLFALEEGKEFRLLLPLNHWAMRAFQGMNHTLKIRYSWDGGHMVRVLDLPPFLSALFGGGQEEARAMAVRNDLFQCDIHSHESAKELLFRLAGVSPGTHEHQLRESPRPDLSLLPMLPTWSYVDEF